MERTKQIIYHPFGFLKQFAKIILMILVSLGNNAAFASRYNIEVSITPIVQGSTSINPKPSRAPAHIPVPFNIVYETDTHTITINGINGSDISLSLYTDDGNEVGNLQYESHENGDITIDNPNSDGFILYIEYQGMTYVANYSLQ